MQNTYRYMAAKQIKHTMTTSRHNALHKRCQYNINQLKKILQNSSLTIVKAHSKQRTTHTQKHGKHNSSFKPDSLIICV